MDALAMVTDGYCLTFIGQMQQQVVLAPMSAEEEQSLLKRILEVPLPDMNTQAQGVHQSDFIFRTALLAGIANLRLHSELLDYCFASLRNDPTTKPAYREQQIQAAKDWFLRTDIPVLLYPRSDQVVFPCITIALRGSEEVDRESTTADTNYETEETVSNYWPTIVGFEPKSFDLATGVIGVPDSLQPLIITTNMIVIDRNGTQHPVTLASTGATIQVAPNSVGDFSQVALKGPPDGYSITLESASFRETYSVGCHAQGEPAYLLYLHSIVTFLLLRYREELLEARGFERSSIASDDVIPDATYLEGKQNVFSRYTRVTGYVRQYWPKFVYPKAQTVSIVLNAQAGAVVEKIWESDNSIG